jgi:hypothetical protein
MALLLKRLLNLSNSFLILKALMYNKSQLQTSVAGRQEDTEEDYRRD